MSETGKPVTEAEAAQWHDMAIKTVVDALVQDGPSWARMCRDAGILACAVLRLLAERDQKTPSKVTFTITSCHYQCPACGHEW